MTPGLETSGLPDQKARDLVREDLERNLLVEAGAGSGKTTALVDRMVALIRHRACEAGQIAAVTFTRKAAGELRQRFQETLEKALADTSPEASDYEALATAVRDIDQAFLGTIHAFCAKLLRERPLEAGLDPAFKEVMEAEAYQMQRRFWVAHMERLAADGDELLGEVTRAGISPDRLEGVFQDLVENPDVDFQLAPVPPPEAEAVAAVREELEGLLDRALEMMPKDEPEKGWDRLQIRVRTLAYWRRALDWDDPNHFFDALAQFYRWRGKPTQNRWASDSLGKKAAKALGEDFLAFGDRDSVACSLMDHWYAYRYPLALSLAQRAAQEFAAERKERGTLNFQDLLVLTADLLRVDPGARRDLGHRYRRVLVDEFQDTDPLQAEILLLLASNPGSSVAGAEGFSIEGGVGEDWRDVIPRPGSLFVVGDPKQSIYRFRRADIALYDFVKSRFKAFGEVLRLEANFRSLPAIETLVEGVFRSEERFPETDTERQAAFAPLLTQRDEGHGLVASYRVESGRQSEVAFDEANRIASCIAERTGPEGDRSPGDFMILTRNRKHLDIYARALEDRNLPVEISGAGVGFEEELRALLMLLRCLADPGNPVRTAAVLSGPLFGSSLEELFQYRNAGGRLEFDRSVEGDGPVVKALATLHHWWTRARSEPADVTVERLVSEIGLFPFAAGGALGQLRAGALVYVMDAVRSAAVAGDASLIGAVQAIETALSWEDAEAPLVPGRKGAVKVMNLHRAKGLEAPVVFLAGPFGESDRTPTKHIARDEHGVARGSMVLAEREGFHVDVIARPLGWDDDEVEEKAFEEAEKVRLLYVAATRAKDELWVVRSEGLSSVLKSPWKPLEDWMDAVGCPVVDLPVVPAPPRQALDPDAVIEDHFRDSEERRLRAMRHSYRIETVSAEAKHPDHSDQEEPRDEWGEVERFTAPEVTSTTRGREWGSVVHAALAASGTGVTGDALEQICRALLIEFERPVDHHGDPTELSVLLTLLRRVEETDLWKRSAESSERHVEIPFALNRAEVGGAPEVLEGVIDLVFLDADGWVVADYKTDQGDDPEFQNRVHQYRAQVDLYARSWTELTGESVQTRALIFTSQGRVETW